MGSIYVVSGGCRSGKSNFAVRQALAYSERYYLATAQAWDKEMAERIALHQLERQGEFITIEAPIAVIEALESHPVTGVLVFDCITLWLSNLIMAEKDSQTIRDSCQSLLDYLSEASFDSYLVTNEVGHGIVPMEAVSRRFRDLAGWINQDIANRSEEAWLLSMGLALPLKKLSRDYGSL